MLAKLRGPVDDYSICGRKRTFSHGEPIHGWRRITGQRGSSRIDAIWPRGGARVNGNANGARPLFFPPPLTTQPKGRRRRHGPPEKVTSSNAATELRNRRGGRRAALRSPHYLTDHSRRPLPPPPPPPPHPPPRRALETRVSSRCANCRRTAWGVLFTAGGGSRGANTNLQLRSNYNDMLPNARPPPGGFPSRISRRRQEIPWHDY